MNQVNMKSDMEPTTGKLSRRSLLAAGAMLPLAGGAWAQSSVGRIVVGFAAGGAADGLARLAADKLRGVVAPSMVVENRIGAGARIAIEYVKNSPPDGTTMVLVPDATMFLYPHVYKELRYDPAKDFTPVTRLISSACSGRPVGSRCATATSSLTRSSPDASARSCSDMLQ